MRAFSYNDTIKTLQQQSHGGVAVYWQEGQTVQSFKYYNFTFIGSSTGRKGRTGRKYHSDNNGRIKTSPKLTPFTNVCEYVRV